MSVEKEALENLRKEYISEKLSEKDVAKDPIKQFGLWLKEAMDAGVPVIASNNSAIPEVLGTDFPGLARTGDVQSFFEKSEE